MHTPIRKGKVYLMGAGPGNPELLTVQAAQILKSAEVVLHDHLVPQEILDLVPAWTQVRNVGKRCGQAGISQDQIHSLLIAAARAVPATRYAGSARSAAVHRPRRTRRAAPR